MWRYSVDLLSELSIQVSDQSLCVLVRSRLPRAASDGDILYQGDACKRLHEAYGGRGTWQLSNKTFILRIV